MNSETIMLVKKQSVIDELWRRTYYLVKDKSLSELTLYHSRIRLNMALRILEDELMTDEEFNSNLYDADIDMMQEWIFKNQTSIPFGVFTVPFPFPELINE